MVPFFSTPAFNRGFCMDFLAHFFAELVVAPPIYGTAKLYGVCVTNTSVFRRTLYGRTLPNTSSTDIAVIVSIKMDDNFASLLNSYLFQRDTESEFPSTLNNMRPSGYYACDIQERILQIPIQPFRQRWPSTCGFGR